MPLELSPVFEASKLIVLLRVKSQDGANEIDSQGG
jgi:hypothetical protein